MPRYETNMTTGEITEHPDEPSGYQEATFRILSVTRFQAFAALLQAGLLTSIEDYMGLPDTDPFTVLAWNTVQEFRRESPLVQSIGVLFGLSPSQLDDIFVFAATIEA